MNDRPGDPLRAQDAEVLRPEPAAGLEEEVAGLHVLAPAADVLAGRDRLDDLDRLGAGDRARQLDGGDGVGPRRDWGPGGDLDRLARPDLPAERPRGPRSPDDLEPGRAVPAGAEGLLAPERVAVHRRAIKGRHVPTRDDHDRQDATLGASERDREGVEGRDVRVDQCRHLADGDPGAEAPHPRVVHRPRAQRLVHPGQSTGSAPSAPQRSSLGAVGPGKKASIGTTPAARRGDSTRTDLSGLQSSGLTATSRKATGSLWPAKPK